MTNNSRLKIQHAQTVMIIDDDEINHFLNSIALKESGLASEPICFNNGSSAIDFLEANHHELGECILFLDIKMPEMTGWQVLSILEASAYRSQLKVFVVSSSIDRGDFERARTYSLVSDFISKPLTIEKCIELIPIIKGGKSPDPFTAK